MDVGIRGKVALITGASSGIGEAVALSLSREGARVAVAARRLERLEDVARRAPEARAPDARAFTADQSHEGSLQMLCAGGEAPLRPIQIPILNGGLPPPPAPPPTHPPPHPHPHSPPP